MQVRKTTVLSSLIAAGFLACSFPSFAMSESAESDPSTMSAAMASAVPITEASAPVQINTDVVAESGSDARGMAAMATRVSSDKTRADVRAELRDAREAGVLSAAGEIAETPTILAARSDFNDRQAQDIIAAYAAQEAQDRALAEAEATRVALESQGDDPLVIVVMVPDANVETQARRMSAVEDALMAAQGADADDVLFEGSRR